MTTDLDIARKGVETVARLVEAEFLRSSPFHLVACGGCGGPCFHQPCSLCGFYPMGSDKGHWHPKEADEALFLAAVERSGPERRNGNIATWLLQSDRNTVAYKERASYRHTVDQAAEKAALLELPPAELYWRVASRFGENLMVHRADFDTSISQAQIWSASNDLLNQAYDLLFKDKIHPKIYAEAKQAISNWVAAAHSEDPAQILEAVRGLGKATGTVRKYAGNGNMHWISERLAEIQGKLEAEATAPAP